MNEFLEYLNTSVSLLGLPTSLLEILGFITGTVCIWLNTRQNVWGWFFSIVNAVLYGGVFWQARLYADASLQVYFFLTSIYGGYMWLYGSSNQQPIPVTLTPPRLYPIFAVIFVLVTILWGYLLYNYTDASLSYPSSALTVLSLIGQFMLARKYLENWLLWIVANVGYVGMFAYKGLYLTSILYFIFFILAIIGYITWQKDYKRNIKAD
jgi:nicotinamide mononucleotide transporter